MLGTLLWDPDRGAPRPLHAHSIQKIYPGKRTPNSVCEVCKQKSRDLDALGSREVKVGVSECG